MSRTALYGCRKDAAWVGPFARGVAFAAIETLLPAGSGWTRCAIERAVGAGEAELLALVRQGAGMPATVCGCVLWRAIVPEAEILQVVVRHAWRGRGHGTRMLAACIDLIRASGVREVFLEVASGNRPALALYRSAGFSRDGSPDRIFRQSGRSADAICSVAATRLRQQVQPMRTDRQNNCDEKAVAPGPIPVLFNSETSNKL